MALGINLGILASSTSGFVNTYSLDFDGVDDRVQLTSDFVASGEFTISFWMKPTVISGNGNVFVMGTFPGNDNYIKMDQIGVLWLRLGATTVIFSESIYGSGVNNLVLNDWQNIMFIRDSSNIIRCYRNGATFGYNISAPSNSNTLTLNSFGRVITNTFGFNGGLDEMAFWNTDETSNVTEIGGGKPTDLTSLNPLAWYRMGDNGDYKSPQWLIPNNENKDKVSNYSFEFDGIDDYINCGDSDNFSFGNGTTDSPFSVSTWINLNSSVANSVIFSKDYGIPNREYAIGFFNSSTNIRFLIKSQGGNNQQSIDSTTSLSLNTWYNVICTYDGNGGNNAADGMNIYINGVLETPTNIVKQSYVAMSNTTAPVNIGRYGAAPALSSAKVDEVSVYNTELLQADVTGIYNGGKPTTISGAVAHWRMGEEATFSGGVWTVPDQIGSNDGTSNAMTIEDRVGTAPSSSNNAVSFNMDLVDRVTDVSS